MSIQLDYFVFPIIPVMSAFVCLVILCVCRAWSNDMSPCFLHSSLSLSLPFIPLLVYTSSLPFFHQASLFKSRLSPCCCASRALHRSCPHAGAASLPSRSQQSAEQSRFPHADPFLFSPASHSSCPRARSPLSPCSLARSLSLVHTHHTHTLVLFPA